jgi:hypothetical protein
LFETRFNGRVGGLAVRIALEQHLSSLFDDSVLAVIEKESCVGRSNREQADQNRLRIIDEADAPLSIPPQSWRDGQGYETGFGQEVTATLSFRTTGVRRGLPDFFFPRGLLMPMVRHLSPYFNIRY